MKSSNLGPKLLIASSILFLLSALLQIIGLIVRLNS